MMTLPAYIFAGMVGGSFSGGLSLTTLPLKRPAGPMYGAACLGSCLESFTARGVRLYYCSGGLEISLLSKLQYYGFEKDDIAGCRSAINKHNIASFSIVSLANALLIMLLSFYPNYNTDSRIFFYVMSAIEILAFFLSRYVYKYKRSSLSYAAFKIYFLFFVCTLMLFCGYVYSIGQSPSAIRFLLMFLSFQIIFVLDTLIILSVNMGVILFFFAINKYCGAIMVAGTRGGGTFDVLNILLSTLICMTLNWYTSHAIIKGIIECNHDQLTGLNNRRSFEQSVDLYTSVCRHVHQTVCIVMMDVDFFKNYNDLYGHTKGDIVLQSIGKTLKELADEYQLYVSRVGGEEFIVMWTENRILEAERIVLKIREKIIDLQIPHENSDAAPYITASFGLYFMRGGSMDTMKELYDYADKALYRAKESGRNCIMLLDSADHNCRMVELRPSDNILRL
jgi:diguanylate cyclase (GGDEF)-like protein